MKGVLALHILALLAVSHAAKGNSCEPYRAKYDQLEVGDYWTKIIQVFGGATRMEDAAHETAYVYEYADCTLTFRAGSNGTLVAKEVNPPLSKEPEPASQVLRVGGGVSAPVVLYKLDPNYAEEARKAGLTGTVGLSLVVDSEGRPRDIHINRSLGLGLDEKAIEAVNEWRFRPGFRKEQPVAIMATIEANFRLQFPHYPRWRLARAVFQIPDGATRPVLAEFAQPRTRDYEGAAQNPTVLHFEVGPDGIPRNLRFTVDPERDVGNDLLAAVNKWRFNPAQKDGVPVSADGTFEFVWEKLEPGRAVQTPAGSQGSVH